MSDMSDQTPPPSSRVNYYDGEYLQSSDFITDQGYHIQQQKSHASYLHSPGITSGLALSASKDGSTVTVAPGSAVDLAGNQILITAAQSMTLPADAKESVFVWAIFCEQLSDQSPTNSPGAQGYMRYSQCSEIKLTSTSTRPAPSSFPSVGPPVLLATAPLDGGKFDASSVSKAICYYAGVALPGNASQPPPDQQYPSYLSDPSKPPAFVTGALVSDPTTPYQATLGCNLVIMGNLSVWGEINPLHQTANPTDDTVAAPAPSTSSTTSKVMAAPAPSGSTITGEPAVRVLCGLVRMSRPRRASAVSIEVLEGDGFTADADPASSSQCRITFATPFAFTPVVTCNLAPQDGDPETDAATRCKVVRVERASATVSLTDGKSHFEGGCFSFVIIGRPAAG